MLHESEIESLVDAALQVRLDRGLLLRRLDHRLRARLPDKDNPYAQLLSDLTVLADWRGASGEQDPLAAWLRSAINDASPFPGPRATFEHALERLDAPFEAGRQAAPFPGGQQHVFLSYATPDRAAVDALHGALVAALPGWSVFQDHRYIRSGRRWFDELMNGLGAASAVVVWATEGLLAARYPAFEVGVATARGARIIPVWAGLAPEAAPHWLSQWQGPRLADRAPGLVAPELVAALEP